MRACPDRPRFAWETTGGRLLGVVNTTCKAGVGAGAWTFAAFAAFAFAGACAHGGRWTTPVCLAPS